jgi:hypothetical protein
VPLNRDQMRAILQEHVDAENALDAERVMATYSREGPVTDGSSARENQG